MAARFLVCCVVFCGSAPAETVVRDVSSLRLVPFPKRVRLLEGQFALDRPLTLEAPASLAPVVRRLLADELGRAGFRAPAFRAADSPLQIRLYPGAPPPVEQAAWRAGASGEDYALRVRPHGVWIVARGRPGLLHGASTLVQLIRANRRGSRLPCLAIDDWPAIGWRAFQDDLTRGPSTKLAQLQRDVARGALLKFNIFTYYMEYQFAFSKHPRIGPPDGSLTPAELEALVRHAQPLGVHIMGNQQSFAHMQHVLAMDEYAHLAEDARTLSPVKEDVYRLLDDLYSDVLPRLPFPLFNVCCDETWGLGERGPSKALAQRIGAGGVYVRHIRRVYDLVHGKYGKRMLIWGDVILRHPDHLSDIPKDVIMLSWGYGPRESFEDQILPFANSGYEFFVCPGVNNWRRVLPHFQNAVTNIRNFVRDGARHGASGVLVTSWDDDGENLNAPNWHGFAWGAECAWNAAKTPVEAFNRRVGSVLFGEPGDHFGQAIALLSTPGICGLTNQAFWKDESEAADRKARRRAEQALAAIAAAIDHLETCRREATTDADLLDAFLFGARRMAFYHQRTLNRVEAAEAYAQALEAKPPEALARLDAAAEALRRTRDAYAALASQWKALWLRENKPYALDWSLARYRRAIAQYDRALEQLAAVRAAAAQGEPLPPAAELGLALGAP